MTSVAPLQFRPLKPGPEAVLQRAVESRLHALFPQQDRLVWTAGSVPLGAGRPDILLTSCEPQVLALTDTDIKAHTLLAYLRAVGRAKPGTISERLGQSLKAVERSLGRLIDSNVVIFDRGGYALAEGWRAVLPEVVTIEVKVADWRRAIAQAARNKLFAHRSFVALPHAVADRVKADPLFRELGIGLLEVEPNGNVSVVRRARRATPKVWSYYYSLAFLAAEHLSEGNRGDVHRFDRRRTRTVS